jgi:hypothetical protein
MEAKGRSQRRMVISCEGFRILGGKWIGFFALNASLTTQFASSLEN